MRQLHQCQYVRMVFEKIGMGFEIGFHRGDIDAVAVELGLGLNTHTSIMPAKTRSAGPVIHNAWPRPSQSMMRSPPGSETVTRRSSSSCKRAIATAAQAPLPQANVSPAPRS